MVSVNFILKSWRIVFEGHSSNIRADLQEQIICSGIKS